MKRFYIPSNAINLQKTQAVINKPDAHHIKNVLRLEKGHVIQIILPDGVSYSASIKSITNDCVITDILSQLNISEPPTHHITVAQSMLKDKKMDTLIRQTTELGVDQWISFISERSIARPSKERMEKKVKRWQSIAKSAAQQCQRQLVPEICEHLLDLSQVFSLISKKDTRGYFFWEKSKKKLETSEKFSFHSMILIFGPEGGFTDNEAKMASDAGFCLLSLGSRILRAETATIVGLSLTQFLHGNLY
jgi:16S rRNA (uracil1498-N3)-methyltransferase